MSIRLYRDYRVLPVLLGILTLAGVGLLLLWDVLPGIFPVGAHDFLAAFPLSLIAFAFLVYQVVRRSSLMEVVKAILLASAFLFWAANQFWPTLRRATLFNDIAIALFVVDVFLTMIERRFSIPDQQKIAE